MTTNLISYCKKIVIILFILISIYIASLSVFEFILIKNINVVFKLNFWTNFMNKLIVYSRWIWIFNFKRFFHALERCWIKTFIIPKSASKIIFQEILIVLLSFIPQDLNTLDSSLLNNLFQNNIQLHCKNWQIYLP